MAFGTGKGALANGKLMNVEFVDLSVSGCAFRIDTISTSKDVVIELGTPPEAMYMQATVKHLTPRIIGDKFTCVVGCQFTGRLA